jgi:glucose/arabinose dehydrogenase
VFNPSNANELWFADTSNSEFNEELNVLSDVTKNYNVNSVPNYGYPYCHGHSDPDYAYYNGSCSAYVGAKYDLDTRITVLGIEFRSAAGLPSNAILFAEKGSVGRVGGEHGYRITYIDLANSSDSSYQVFADGWLQGLTENTSWGRPVDVRKMLDDSILVSDEKAGAVYRFYYTGGAAASMISIAVLLLSVILTMM